MKVTLESLTGKITKAKEDTKGKEGADLKAKKKNLKRLQRRQAKMIDVQKRLDEKMKKKGEAAAEKAAEASSKASAEEAPAAESPAKETKEGE